MPTEILVATAVDGRTTRYLLDVFQDGQTWTSTLRKLNERGEPLDAAVAPRFYGVSQEQARRRMISVLENQYEDVRGE
ncbi:hypothetical protein RAS1_38070 [Phycisphaerae bacterium RAS1]|nr:hypothetical protein RAS1_38070 [Phycisphaerae bacterium RAS1]